MLKYCLQHSDHKCSSDALGTNCHWKQELSCQYSLHLPVELDGFFVPQEQKISFNAFFLLRVTFTNNLTTLIKQTSLIHLKGMP